MNRFIEPFNIAESTRVDLGKANFVLIGVKLLWGSSIRLKI